MKTIKSVLLFSLLSNLILSLVIIKSFLEKNNLFVNKPEIVSKVNTRKIAEAKIEFDKIVKEEFKIGMPEIELIKELNRQGFTPSWSYKERLRAAGFVRSNIACNSVWSVIWEADQFGNISKINGEYRATCL